MTMTREEFYNVLSEWTTQPLEKWNHVTMVAFFYSKFKEKNGIDFMPVRWSGNPASSKECRDIAKLFRMFVPENYDDLNPFDKIEYRQAAYQKIYHYIDWMFNYKHRMGDSGKAITTQFFLAPYTLNEFLIMYNKAKNKQKTKSKIDLLITWCKTETPEIFEKHQLETASDLKFIEKYIQSYKLDQNSLESRVINKSKELGLI